MVLFSWMFSVTMQNFHAVTAGIIVYTKITLSVLPLKLTLRRHWFPICILCKSISWLLIYQNFLPSRSSTDHAQLIHQASETHISRDLTSEQEQPPFWFTPENLCSPQRTSLDFSCWSKYHPVVMWSRNRGIWLLEANMIALKVNICFCSIRKWSQLSPPKFLMLEESQTKSM